MPQVAKQLKSFLGLANYFRDHVQGYSEITALLQGMILDYHKTRKLKWDTGTELAFNATQTAIKDIQMLFFLTENDPVYLHTDASDHGIGAYLFQIVNGVERPIQFLSKSLNDVQKRWSTTEKECYAIFYSMKQFEHLIKDRFFVLRTDHANLIYINSSPSQKVMRWKLAIQGYDFKLQHIPGRLNVVADNMSRLCLKEPLETGTSSDFVFALCSLYEMEDTEEGESEIPLMAFDASLRESGKSKPTQGSPFIEGAKSSSSAIAEATQTRVRGGSSIPISEEKYRLFTQAHSDVVGHLGVEKSKVALIKILQANPSLSLATDTKSLMWRGAERELRQFIKECPVCQKLARTNKGIVTVPFTSSDYLPMRKLNVDSMGPFDADAQGNIYIIVVIDCFSRYVGLYPAVDCTAEAAAEALLSHVCIFGAPLEILSDQGSQYVNRLITALCILIGSDKLETISYSKQENGLVERANKEVLRHLRAILFNRDIKSDWRLCLPLVQRIMNATYHESVGTSPASIITPYVDLDRGILVPLGASEVPSELVSDWIRRLQSKQSAVLSIAQRVLKERDDKHMLQNRLKETVTEFPIGSYVLVEYPGQIPSKMLMPRRGPLQVVKISRTKAYTLVDLITQKEETVHVSRLTPFLYDKERVDPFDVAAKEQKEFRIDFVYEHVGDPRLKSSLEFKCRFTGYSEEHDEWIPWGNLFLVPALHNYLYSHDELLSLVPKEFRRPNHPELLAESLTRRRAKR